MKENDQINADVAMRADEIFYSALAIEDMDERTTYVETACKGDQAVRHEVDLLFDSLNQSENFFEEGTQTRISAVEIANTLSAMPEFFEQMKTPLPDDDEVGKQIGNYKLLHKIGEGGGGNVYLAEQVKPVRRQVAFKIIKLGMDTKSVIARFEAERQALAMMEHPNIAHVLNAGETETGRPFFVMEMVHGVKITTYCDDNHLDLPHRLELFIHVCHAIQHAHQKGIIHRDIKPSNVLITIHDGVPMPKVIDFGIAKATKGDLLTEEQTFFTSQEPFIGTPAYMSPEQADFAHTDIDMRSDIYSLGILLYELLAGRPPFEQKELVKSGLEAMRRTLRESEPPRPSAKFQAMPADTKTAVAQNRNSDPRKLAGLLGSELDWIVLKTLEKDRDLRYQTADGLAEDVLRYLHNEPVLARPPSRRYRFRKLVRRNKGVFASITAISIALIAGFGTSSVLLIKERKAHLRAVTAEHQALAAERQQKRLRQQAEDRERITQAAFLVGQKKMVEAEKLASQVTELKPSLETEAVLRKLGEWYALTGAWTQAANRFNRLLKVDIKDDSWAITEDALMAGPVLIEQGNIQGYEQFRKAAIARYQGTTDPVFAERTLKISLLLPADEQIMKQLAPFADTASMATQGPVTPTDYMAAWRSISLALMAYRKNYAPTAIAWCKRSLACTDNNSSRIATAHIIQALAYYQLRETQSANAELALGRKMTEAAFADGLKMGDGSKGFWYDWLFARILLKEAESLISGSTPSQ